MEHGTAVHMCSISNSFDCLKFLLESEYGTGYSLDEFDEKGKLPLTLACERLCSENVVTLFEGLIRHIFRSFSKNAKEPVQSFRTFFFTYL